MPEFMHDRMYDEKHRFHCISTNPKTADRLLQKGLREPLLCGECEQRFSKFEEYAAKLLNQRIQVHAERRGRNTLFSGLDYRLLKTFFLSLLWRFAVTRLPSYSGVKLGPHEEKLRCMLWENTPGSEHEYGCMATGVMIDGVHRPDFILPPFSLRTPTGQRVWGIVVAGFVLMFLVSSHQAPSVMQTGFLRKEGTLLVAWREATEIRYVSEVFRMFGKADVERNQARASRRDCGPQV